MPETNHAGNIMPETNHAGNIMPERSECRNQSLNLPIILDSSLKPAYLIDYCHEISYLSYLCLNPKNFPEKIMPESYYAGVAFNAGENLKSCLNHTTIKANEKE